MEQHVEGSRTDRKVYVWALSTCMWCKKAKKFLEDQSVDFTYEFVDLLEGEERDRVLSEIEKHNPATSFPTILIDGKCIVGFDEAKLKAALGL